MNFKEDACKTLRTQYRCQCNDCGGQVLTGVSTVDIEQIWKDYDAHYANSKLDVCSAIKQLIRLKTVVDENTKKGEP